MPFPDPMSTIVLPEISLTGLRLEQKTQLNHLR